MAYLRFSNFNSVKCNGVNQEDKAFDDGTWKDKPTVGDRIIIPTYCFEFLLTWTIYGEDKILYRYTDFRIFSLEGIKTYVEQKELEFKEMAVSKNCCIHFSFKHLREIIAVTLGTSTSPLKEEIRVIDNTYLGHWDDGLIVVTPGGGPWRLR